MGLHKTEAIVLRSINLSETDKLVTCLTKDYGKIKCSAKSARKIKNPFAGSLEPLSHVNLVYFGKENQQIYRLNHSDIIRPFQSVRENLKKLYTGVYFIDLVNAMVPESQQESGIFHFLLSSLATLENQENPETLRMMFEVRFLSLSGYTPQLHHCTICKSEKITDWTGFSYRRNGIVCGSCPEQKQAEIRFKTGTLTYLKKLLSLDIKNSGRLKFPKGVGEQIGNMTHKLILSHLGRELKSYPFIKAMAEVG